MLLKLIGLKPECYYVMECLTEVIYNFELKRFELMASCLQIIRGRSRMSSKVKILVSIIFKFSLLCMTKVLFHSNFEEVCYRWHELLKRDHYLIERKIYVLISGV